MGIYAELKSRFIGTKAASNNPSPPNTQQTTTQGVDPGGSQFEGSIFKAYIPDHLYKPPFGYPRPASQDVSLLRKLGSNGYIHSVISTIQFEVASAKWDIVPKDGNEESPDEIKRLKDFFRNPNGNSESFEYIIRAVMKDLLELDSGVLIKVFDGQGDFKQLFARDGASFLKNPDIYGYLGNRDDFIPSFYYSYDPVTRQYKFENKFKTPEDVQMVAERAAFYQYGWSPGIPIPFGKREVVWLSAYPQTNNVYGRSPLQVLGDILYTLLYGASFNLDFYINNNIPDGVLSIIGANKDDIRAFRERLQGQIIQKDVFDNKRKRFYTAPIVNVEAKFTPMVFNSKDMEVLEQQKWFWKLVMACFGVTPDEMGFTEDSNKAVSQVQTGVFRRKAVAPYLRLLEYHINLQIMRELDPTGKYEFKYIETDLAEELQKMQLYQLQIQMGIKTPEMVAEEEGIDIERLKKEKEEQMAQQLDQQLQLAEAGAKASASNQGKPQQKSLTTAEEKLPGLDEYFNQTMKELEPIIRELGYKESQLDKL